MGVYVSVCIWAAAFFSELLHLLSICWKILKREKEEKHSNGSNKFTSGQRFIVGIYIYVDRERVSTCRIIISLIIIIISTTNGMFLNRIYYIFARFLTQNGMNFFVFFVNFKYCAPKKDKISELCFFFLTSRKKMCFPHVTLFQICNARCWIQVFVVQNTFYYDAKYVIQNTLSYVIYVWYLR